MAKSTFARVSESPDPLRVLNAPMEDGLIPDPFHWTGRISSSPWCQRKIKEGDQLWLQFIYEVSDGSDIPDRKLKLFQPIDWGADILENPITQEDKFRELKPSLRRPSDVAKSIHAIAAKIIDDNFPKLSGIDFSVQVVNLDDPHREKRKKERGIKEGDQLRVEFLYERPDGGDIPSDLFRPFDWNADVLENPITKLDKFRKLHILDKSPWELERDVKAIISDFIEAEGPNLSDVDFSVQVINFSDPGPDGTGTEDHDRRFDEIWNEIKDRFVIAIYDYAGAKSLQRRIAWDRISPALEEEKSDPADREFIFRALTKEYDGLNPLYAMRAYEKKHAFHNLSDRKQNRVFNLRRGLGVGHHLVSSTCDLIEHGTKNSSETFATFPNQIALTLADDHLKEKFTDDYTQKELSEWRDAYEKDGSIPDIESKCLERLAGKISKMTERPWQRIVFYELDEETEARCREEGSLPPRYPYFIFLELLHSAFRHAYNQCFVHDRIDQFYINLPYFGAGSDPSQAAE